MQSDILQKWNYINEWYIANHKNVYGDDYYQGNLFIGNAFSDPSSSDQIIELEQLLGAEIPSEVKTLLKSHNGETGQNNSPFFELRMLSTVDMKDLIQFSLSLSKPSNRYIKNPEKSNQLIYQIIEEVKLMLPNKEWFKMTFRGGEVGFGMPTLYFNSSDAEKENILIKHEKAAKLIKLLQEEERETYDWDDIKFTVYEDGRMEVIRTDTDWNDGFTAFPPETVKAQYFHHKWLPIFSDNGGNYIGVDLDPDQRGIRGQTIIYGRDIYENIRVANSLEDLFDKIITDLEKGNNSLILKNTRYHIHERFKLLA